jgi:hypothetical protein
MRENAATISRALRKGGYAAEVNIGCLLGTEWIQRQFGHLQ